MCEVGVRRCVREVARRDAGPTTCARRAGRKGTVTTGSGGGRIVGTFSHAALLSGAAMIAILRLKAGMLPTLAGSALAGVLLLAASG